MRKKSVQNPDLDKYLKGRKKYVNYLEGATLYSMPYFRFVRLAREAGANYKKGKKVYVDLDVLEVYMENLRDKET